MKSELEYLYIPSAVSQYRSHVCGLSWVKRAENNCRAYSSLQHYFAKALADAGFTSRHKTWFDTLCIEVADKTAVARAEKAKVNLRTDIRGAVGVTFSEITTRQDLNELFAVITGVETKLDFEKLDQSVSNPEQAIPSSMLRDDEFLAHQIFIVTIVKPK